MKYSDCAAYPLSEPLPQETLVYRLKTFAGSLHAFEQMRDPRASARFRIAVKANIGTDEFATTAGALALQSLHVPDAFCVGKLKEAKCDVFAKASMTELAGFVSTANLERAYSFLGGWGVNPHGAFPSGGSSSGPAIATAAGLCDAALGTETRGSLMIPGLRCGVYAYKPTRGLISRSGIVPLSHHFDTTGVIARNLDDALTLVKIMQGVDPDDPQTQVSAAIDLNAQPVFDSEEMRAAFCVPENSGCDETTLQVITQRLRNSVRLIPHPAAPIEFDYKRITSLDIRRDMDCFLSAYARENEPHSFTELYRFYAEHPQARPNGMDRLTDALGFAEVSEAELDALAQRSIARARLAIDEVLEKTQAQCVIAPWYFDWWSIAGAPSITIPLGKSPIGKPFGVMLGCRCGEDAKLFALAKRLIAGLSQSN